MKYVIFLLLIVLLLSCGEQETGAGRGMPASVENHEEENHSKPQSINHDMELKLNNGKRWLVNDEMKPFVLKGEATLMMYLENSDTNYIELAEKLKATNSQLISNCTMTGESHDELHKWLHPHLTLVGKLQKSTSQEDAERVVFKIKKSFETYHHFFE